MRQDLPAGGIAARSGFRGCWPYLAVSVLFWLLPGLYVLYGYNNFPDYNANGQCEGIGGGCVMTPKDGALFAALFYYPVLAAVGLVVMGVIAVARRQRTWFVLLAVAAMGMTLWWQRVLAGTTGRPLAGAWVVVVLALVLGLVGARRRWRR